MQDITEQHEIAQEISDIISKPVGYGEEFDEVSWIILTALWFLLDIYYNSKSIPHLLFSVIATD